MPELPEVEVTRRGIAPHLEGRRIDAITVRNGALRWPVPDMVRNHLAGAVVQTVGRRGKFILIECVGAAGRGTLMIHLGMTGTLRILERGTAPSLHDHVDILLGKTVMRYHDPRRFGALLWHDSRDGPIEANPHLANLGVEPFAETFAADWGGDLLFRATRGRTVAVKQMLLSGRIVVGVGNIYASESLFRAHINPKAAAGRIGLARYRLLAQAIRDTLAAAIEKGGSTLRDFIASDGSAGYFQLEYFVYDRAGLPCRICGTSVKTMRQGQRSTFYCPRCQRH